MNGEAGALLHLGRLAEAETVARRVLAIRLGKFPETSIQVALTRLRLGEILTAKKRYAEADGLLRQAADSLAAAGPGTDEQRKKAIKARIELYEKWGKPAEAQAQQALLAVGVNTAPK